MQNVVSIECEQKHIKKIHVEWHWSLSSVLAMGLTRNKIKYFVKFYEDPIGNRDRKTKTQKYMLKQQTEEKIYTEN
jgi:hypothetical protein